MLKFSHDEMTKKLEGLPDNLRPLFAGLVSERFYPHAVKFFQEKNPGLLLSLGAGLEEIWRYSLEGLSDEDARNRLLGECMIAIQNAADDESDAGFFAENAAASIAYGLRSIESNDPKEAAWAGQTGYDIVDRFVLIQEQSMNASWTEAEILAHPVIQRELDRQQKDIETLSKIGKSQSLLVDLQKLRDEARLESNIIFS